MRVRTKIVCALPFPLSVCIIRRIFISTMTQSGMGTTRRYRKSLEESESPAAPLKREWVGAEG
jgi:hypothetical protein